MYSFAYTVGRRSQSCSGTTVSRVYIHLMREKITTPTGKYAQLKKMEIEFHGQVAGFT